MTDHNARQAGLTSAAQIALLWAASEADNRGLDLHATELRAILAAHSADARNGQGVAQGWKLVPVEPTDEMVVAFAEAWFSKVRPIDDCMMNDAYAAMLDAAPAAPAPHANCPAPVDATEAAEREHLGCAHCNTGIYAAPAPAAQVDELPLAREVRATLNLIANSFHNCKGSAATMQELARDCLQRFDAARQQSATPAECTCPSGNGSLRHPCPAHPADAASEAIYLAKLRNGTTTWLEFTAEAWAKLDSTWIRCKADAASEAGEKREILPGYAFVERNGGVWMVLAPNDTHWTAFRSTPTGDLISAIVEERERQQGAGDA